MGWDTDYVTLNILLPVGIKLLCVQAFELSPIDVYKSKNQGDS